MDIALLGASIDPTGAIQGGQRATQAAQQMAAGMNAAGTQAARAQQNVGTAGRQMGQQVAAGAQQAAAAIQTTAGTGAWDRIRAQARAAAAGVFSAFDSMRNAAANFASSAGNNVLGMFSRIRAAASGLSGRGFVDMANAAGLLNNPLGQAISRLTSFRALLSGMPGFVAPLVASIGLLAAAFLGVGTAISTTFAAMQAAGPIQAAELGLQTVTGSAEQADAVLTALRENAKRTGADLGASLDTGLKFIGLGFSPADAVKLNQSIQDIAGTLGMSSTRAAELGNALAQVQSKGVVSMEELRQQIAEKGVPVFEELAKKLNVSQGQLIDMVSKGKVASKELIDIFLNLEGGFAKFAGGAERGTAKLPGAIARIKANYNDLLVTMGAPINDAVTPILNAISDAMGGLQGTAATIGQTIADGITSIAPTLNAFVEEAAGKIQGFLAMVNSEAGLGEAWARNIWATFVSFGLSAVEQITAGFAVIGQLLARAAVDLIENLAIITTPEFWATMGATFDSIAISFENGLRAAAEAMLNLIIDNAPAWLTGGQTERANFGRIANPTIPQPKLVAPDLFNDNNEPLDITAMFEKNVAGMKTVLDGTRQEWQKWADDWNRLNLQPAADKLKTTAQLSTTGAASSGLAGSGADDLKKKASEADKLARQMEASARRYIEANRTPLEKYAATIAEVNTLQAAGLLTVDQAARASVAALDALNEGTRRAAEKAATPLEKLMLKWGDLKTQIQTVNASIAETFDDGVGGAVTSLINGTASAADAFSAMAASIVQDITKMIVKLLIQYAIQQALGLVTGGVSTATFTAASANAATAAVKHTGGDVGDSFGTFRSVPASSFRNAPKFAHGGDIASGETPIIAEPGEKVLTRDQASDIKKRLGDTEKGQQQQGRQPVTILNVVDPALVRDAIAKNPDLIVNAISGQAGKIKRVLSLA